MINERFHKKISEKYSLKYLASQIDALIDPDDASDIQISDIKPIQNAHLGDLTFIFNKKYAKNLDTSNASACIVGIDFNRQNKTTILLRTQNPHFAYAKLFDLFYQSQKSYTVNYVSPSACVANSAQIGLNCHIGHNVVIDDHVEIGDDCIIEANSYIGYGSKIGARAKIHSNVSIEYCIIGDNVVILSGARIGQDGFGFAAHDGTYHKIYHAGIVCIGNNVEIGANTTIDRGSIENTIIEDWCRIDNLVQVGHGTHIGKGSILAGQVGVAGSTKIGKYCTFGGKVGVAGHLKIADHVTVLAGSGVTKNILDPKSTVGGYPAVSVNDWHRQTILMKKLVRDK